MQIRTRGTQVDFSHSFLNAAGAVIDTDTATLVLSYPGLGWPHNGTDRETATIELEETAENAWEGSWDSRLSQPGVVFWTIYTDDSGNAAADGHFRLRANPANLLVEA